jgi:16S rRNA (guanine966-N2)-methyltransferase
VLDLYAGSGALGLEAASRGARVVTLVENNFAAAALCKKNAEAVQRAAPKAAQKIDSLQIKVSAQAVQSFLASTPDGFDLVFLDPPYDLSEIELAGNLSALVPLLDPHALVIVERDSRSPEPTWGDALAAERSKKYGDTTVWYASPVQPA